MSIHEFNARLSSLEPAGPKTFLGGLRKLTAAEKPLMALRGYTADCPPWQLWDSTAALVPAPSAPR